MTVFIAWDPVVAIAWYCSLNCVVEWWIHTSSTPQSFWPEESIKNKKTIVLICYIKWYTEGKNQEELESLLALEVNFF